MSKLAVLALAVLSLGLSSGCGKTYRLENDVFATPAYSSRERAQRNQRAWDYDWKEMNEDIDTVLLLGEPSTLTLWNVR